MVGLKDVEVAVVFEDDTPYACDIEKLSIRPAKGSDYAESEIVGSDFTKIRRRCWGRLAPHTLSFNVRECYKLRIKYDSCYRRRRLHWQ